MSTDAYVSSDHPTNVRGSRVGAAIIDILVLLLPAILAAFSFLEQQDGVTSCDQVDGTLKFCFAIDGDIWAAVDGRAMAWLGVNAIIGIAYYVVLQGLTGWTFGKAAVGIRVVNERGEVCGVGKALLRYLPLLVPGLIPVAGALLGPVLLLVEFILVMAQPRRQRLGDMLAKTFVVRKEALGQPVP